MLLILPGLSVTLSLPPLFMLLPYLTEAHPCSDEGQGEYAGADVLISAARCHAAAGGPEVHRPCSAEAGLGDAGQGGAREEGQGGAPPPAQCAPAGQRGGRPQRLAGLHRLPHRARSYGEASVGCILPCYCV